MVPDQLGAHSIGIVVDYSSGRNSSSSSSSSSIPLDRRLGFLPLPRLTACADYMNFDNILWALLVVFQCMTMEDRQASMIF